MNEPIPQIYTEMNPQILQVGSDEIEFNIYATTDYKIDDSQIINLEFIVTPFEVTVDGTSGQQVKRELTDKAFTISTYKVSQRNIRMKL